MTEAQHHLITKKEDFISLFKREADQLTLFPKECYFSNRKLIPKAINYFLEGLVKVKQYSSMTFPENGLSKGKRSYRFRCNKCPSRSCILSLEKDNKNMNTPLRCIAKVFRDSPCYTLECDSIDGINEWKYQNKQCENFSKNSVLSSKKRISPSSR